MDGWGGGLDLLRDCYPEWDTRVQECCDLLPAGHALWRQLWQQYRHSSAALTPRQGLRLLWAAWQNRGRHYNTYGPYPTAQEQERVAGVALIPMGYLQAAIADRRFIRCYRANMVDESSSRQRDTIIPIPTGRFLVAAAIETLARYGDIPNLIYQPRAGMSAVAFQYMCVCFWRALWQRNCDHDSQAYSRPLQSLPSNNFFPLRHRNRMDSICSYMLEDARTFMTRRASTIGEEVSRLRNLNELMGGFIRYIFLCERYACASTTLSNVLSSLATHKREILARANALYHDAYELVAGREWDTAGRLDVVRYEQYPTRYDTITSGNADHGSVIFLRGDVSAATVGRTALLYVRYPDQPPMNPAFAHPTNSRDRYRAEGEARWDTSERAEPFGRLDIVVGLGICTIHVGDDGEPFEPTDAQFDTLLGSDIRLGVTTLIDGHDVYVVSPTDAQLRNMPDRYYAPADDSNFRRLVNRTNIGVEPGSNGLSLRRLTRIQTAIDTMWIPAASSVVITDSMRDYDVLAEQLRGLPPPDDDDGDDNNDSNQENVNPAELTNAIVLAMINNNQSQSTAQPTAGHQDGASGDAQAQSTCLDAAISTFASLHNEHAATLRSAYAHLPETYHSLNVQQISAVLDQRSNENIIGPYCLAVVHFVAAGYNAAPHAAYVPTIDQLYAGYPAVSIFEQGLERWLEFAESAALRIGMRHVVWRHVLQECVAEGRFMAQVFTTQMIDSNRRRGCYHRNFEFLFHFLHTFCVQMRQQDPSAVPEDRYYMMPRSLTRLIMAEITNVDEHNNPLSQEVSDRSGNVVYRRIYSGGMEVVFNAYGEDMLQFAMAHDIVSTAADYDDYTDVEHDADFELGPTARMNDEYVMSYHEQEQAVQNAIGLAGDATAIEIAERQIAEHPEQQSQPLSGGRPVEIDYDPPEFVPPSDDEDEEEESEHSHDDESPAPPTPVLAAQIERDRLEASRLSQLRQAQPESSSSSPPPAQVDDDISSEDSSSSQQINISPIQQPNPTLLHQSMTQPLPDQYRHSTAANTATTLARTTAAASRLNVDSGRSMAGAPPLTDGRMTLRAALSLQPDSPAFARLRSDPAMLRHWVMMHQFVRIVAPDQSVEVYCIGFDMSGVWCTNIVPGLSFGTNCPTCVIRVNAELPSRSGHNRSVHPINMATQPMVNANQAWPPLGWGVTHEAAPIQFPVDSTEEDDDLKLEEIPSAGDTPHTPPRSGQECLGPPRAQTILSTPPRPAVTRTPPRPAVTRRSSELTPRTTPVERRNRGEQQKVSVRQSGRGRYLAVPQTTNADNLVQPGGDVTPTVTGGVAHSGGGAAPLMSQESTETNGRPPTQLAQTEFSSPRNPQDNPEAASSMMSFPSPSGSESNPRQANHADDVSSQHSSDESGLAHDAEPTDGRF